MGSQPDEWLRAVTQGEQQSRPNKGYSKALWEVKMKSIGPEERAAKDRRVLATSAVIRDFSGIALAGQGWAEEGVATARKHLGCPSMQSSCGLGFRISFRAYRFRTTGFVFGPSFQNFGNIYDRHSAHVFFGGGLCMRLFFMAGILGCESVWKTFNG